MPASIQQADNCTICVQTLDPKIKPTRLSTLQPCGHQFHSNPCFNNYMLHLVEPALKKNVELASLITCPNCKADVKFIDENMSSSNLINSMKDKLHRSQLAYLYAQYSIQEQKKSAITALVYINSILILLT